MTTSVFKYAYLPIVSGDAGVWGGYLNTRTFVTFDANLGGLSSIAVSNADYVLSSTESASAILRITGTITTAILVTTLCQGFTFVENVTSGAHDVTITNGVASVVVPQGCVSLVIFDSTNGARFGAVNFASNADVLAGTSAVKAVTPAALFANFQNHYNALVEQSITASTSTLNIDMSHGWNVNLTLSANVTAINITNWPASGILGKLTIEINSTGAYSMTGWPTPITWPGAVVPTITSGNGKKDTVIISSGNGATSYRAYTVAQNMS